MSRRFPIVDAFTTSALAGNARAVLLAGLSLVSTAAFAQNRTGDNAITQAEDAFGFSVGRESIGIYNATQARGFSPTLAGNVRIDGLYFAPAVGLQDLLINNVSIKVGLSAQGYPFAAPSGIVDRGNHSCAGDLAALARAILREPRLARIVRRRQVVLPFPIKGGRLYLYNNNPLLRMRYPGTTGIKTGYTDAAGHCLVASARRGPVKIGVVLLHSPDPGKQAMQLLDRGFAAN